LAELPKKLGASIGLAPAQSGDTLTSLMQRADATMYKAKRGGKGKAELAS
jgi:predicted signal transduction protein with EAL and GGDEF domain